MQAISRAVTAPFPPGGWDDPQAVLDKVDAIGGPLKLTASDNGQEAVTENDVPWIMPFAFYDGSVFKYAAVCQSAPVVAGGSGVSITDEGGSNQNIKDAGHLYLITSSTGITKITAGGTSLSAFAYYEGDFVPVVKWYQPDPSQTIPSGNDRAFILARTEDLGTSNWQFILDGTAYGFSQNVTNHLLKAPISKGASHTADVNYVSGGKGLELTAIAYAAKPMMGTWTSPWYEGPGIVSAALAIDLDKTPPIDTGVTIEYRGKDLQGNPTPWTSAWRTVPKNGALQVRLTLSTSDTSKTPEVS